MLFKIVAFVVPLGFDTLAVAVALGLRGVPPLRPALAFAFFEAMMPLIGLLLGHFIGARFEAPAVVAGGIVLLGVAAYMLKEALETGDETADLSFSSLRNAMLAGFGISMDELVIGFPDGNQRPAHPCDHRGNCRSSVHRDTGWRARWTSYRRSVWTPYLAGREPGRSRSLRVTGHVSDAQGFIRNLPGA